MVKSKRNVRNAGKALRTGRNVRKRFKTQDDRQIRKQETKQQEKGKTEELETALAGNSVSKTESKTPHSFVFHRGKVGRYLRILESDIRKVMEPYTASKLKVLKKNNMRDFIINGAPLGVTHLLVITRGEQHAMLRIIRSPHGPTISFKIEEFCLAKDVVSSIRHPIHFQQQFINPPLVVLNGFNDPEKKHLKLVQSMFQNMFPSINVDTLKLTQIRRCLLICYDNEKDQIDIRHYGIKAALSGLCKPLKKLMQNKVPDLSTYKDISDYFLNPGCLSDSEFEGEKKEVDLPQNLNSRGCVAGQKTSIRLVELGPRLTLKVMKIEEGIDEGEVLYHSYIEKTPRELVEQRRNLSRKKKNIEKLRKKNELRVIRRLKSIAEKRAADEDLIAEEKERLINKHRAVIGDEDEKEDETSTVEEKNDVKNKERSSSKISKDGRKREIVKMKSSKKALEHAESLEMDE